ncbi:hypothetical protein Cni_G20224 [Canna indica]|uniref:Uncharacterized protein n=1 Tax=Canna indica TaxID=4628 RepID=A0AAQ3QJB4_9LILI|nr:hypothetical protein Cni_G20224 [Canna indica]
MGGNRGSLEDFVHEHKKLLFCLIFAYKNVPLFSPHSIAFKLKEESGKRKENLSSTLVTLPRTSILIHVKINSTQTSLRRRPKCSLESRLWQNKQAKHGKEGV